MTEENLRILYYQDIWSKSKKIAVHRVVTEAILAEAEVRFLVELPH